MKSVASVSLSGGQGKTTVSLFLGRHIAQLGYKVLMVDADPQSSLTFYLRQQIAPNDPTLLEVIKGEVPAEQGIYQGTWDNLWLIPADDALDKAGEYLSNSVMGEMVLYRRLQAVNDIFDFCVIDAPPQRSQICLTTIGAADAVLIPVEASSKGLNSLMRTLALIKEMREVRAFNGEILGVLPFRDKWLGRTQTTKSRDSIEAMREVAGEIPLLPSILESERFKQAMDRGLLLNELGYPDLEYSFQKVLDILGASHA